MLRRSAFVVTVLVQLAVLYAPTSPVGPPPFPFADKLIHAGVFALVAWTGRRAGVAPGWLAAALAAHAGLSELGQHVLLPRRTGDLADVGADLAGVVVGVLVPVRLVGSGLLPTRRAG